MNPGVYVVGASEFSARSVGSHSRAQVVSLCGNNLPQYF